MILLCCLPQATSSSFDQDIIDKPQYFVVLFAQANNIHYFVNRNCTLVIGFYMVAGDIFHLTIKMKGSLSSLVNKTLLNRDTSCNEHNSTIIILWTFLSTTEEML